MLQSCTTQLICQWENVPAGVPIRMKCPVQRYTKNLNFQAELWIATDVSILPRLELYDWGMHQWVYHESEGLCKWYMGEASGEDFCIDVRGVHQWRVCTCVHNKGSTSEENPSLRHRRMHHGRVSAWMHQDHCGLGNSMLYIPVCVCVCVSIPSPQVSPYNNRKWGKGFLKL